MQTIYNRHNLGMPVDQKGSAVLPILSSYMMDKDESIMSLKVFAGEAALFGLVVAAIALIF